MILGVIGIMLLIIGFTSLYNFIVIGIMMIIVGLVSLYESRVSKTFYDKLKNGKLKEYIKIRGTVICNAYPIDEATELIKPVTPIVEYEVNGEKYETCNDVLSTNAELPVGTQVYLWYKKDDPKEAILGTSLDSYYFSKLLGKCLIFIGLIFIFGSI